MMSLTKLSNLWQILKDHEPSSLSSVPIELKCTLCKKLLTYSCRNVCGCRYCYFCILNYLNNSSKCCPGLRTKCKEKLITISEDIEIDQEINKKISKIGIKCPAEGCLFQGTLLEFVDHVNESHKNNIELMEGVVCVTNLKECFPGESHDLKQRIKKDKLERLLHQMNEFQQALNYLVDDMKEMRVDMNSMSSSLSQRQSCLKSGLPNVSSEENTDQKTKSNLIKSRLDEKYYFCFQWNVSNFLKKYHQAINDEKKTVSSKSFYVFKNQYRMRLKMWPNGVGEARGTHLTAAVLLLKGKNDNNLMWPLKHVLSLRWIDPESGEAILKSDYQYDSAKDIDKPKFAKPVSKANEPIGTLRFISFEKLFACKSFCRFNRITLELLID